MISCQEIIKESIPFDQMQSTKPVPDVVFVSQEPKELKFPTKFTIRTKAKKKTKGFSLQTSPQAYKYRILGKFRKPISDNFRQNSWPVWGQKNNSSSGAGLLHHSEGTWPDNWMTQARFSDSNQFAFAKWTGILTWTDGQEHF